jgi:hypothetical protein
MHLVITVSKRRPSAAVSDFGGRVRLRRPCPTSAAVSDSGGRVRLWRLCPTSAAVSDFDGRVQLRWPCPSSAAVSDFGGRVRPWRPCLTLAAGDIADLVKSSLMASGASGQGVWGVYGCSFSSRFQGLHQQPYPTLAAGDITAFSFRRPYLPAHMSSHETVHTDPYMWGEGGWLKVAVFSRRRPSLAAMTLSESSFLCLYHLFSMLNPSDCRKKEGG